MHGALLLSSQQDQIWMIDHHHLFPPYLTATFRFSSMIHPLPHKKWNIHIRCNWQSNKHTWRKSSSNHDCTLRRWYFYVVPVTVFANSNHPNVILTNFPWPFQNRTRTQRFVFDLWRWNWFPSWRISTQVKIIHPSVHPSVVVACRRQLVIRHTSTASTAGERAFCFTPSHSNGLYQQNQVRARGRDNLEATCEIYSLFRLN